MWTKEDLQKLIKENLGDFLFVVVSNRQPYIHSFSKGKISCQRGAGGVITALDPILQACGGTWVAFSNGEADHKVVNDKGELMVPPDNPSYKLKRVFLTKEEEKGYYLGFSNEALWPLCHQVFQRPTLRREDWECYLKVNEKFAEAVLEEVGDKKAFIWIQDYHLAILPKFLKEKASQKLIVSHFWHIPWPSYAAFRICPQKREILEGLLANDFLGFHIQHFCSEFLTAVETELESKTDRERFSVIYKGHETILRPYPISIDFEGINKLSQTEEIEKMVKNFREEYSLQGVKILLGLDRLDYTKGIPEKLWAVDRLIERHPEMKGKFVFFQKGVPSRTLIPRYKALNDQVDDLAAEINWRHSTQSWKPIILEKRHLSFKELLAFYRLGDICVIGSLHDGMNLVAKEFIASRADNGGMLVLSQFTGSARELEEAIMINPYDRDQFADSLFQALNLSEEERGKRMLKLRERVRENNIYRWAGKILSTLFKLEIE